MIPRLNRFVARHSKAVIALLAVSTMIAGSGLRWLWFDTDILAMIPADTPELVHTEWTEDYFGIQDPALIAIVNDGPHGIFVPETLELIRHLSGALKELESLDGDDLVSLSTVDNITAADDTLTVEPFFLEAPRTMEAALAIRAAVFANPMMVGTIVSKDATTTAIVAELVEGHDKVELYAQLRRIVEAAPVGDESVTITGRPVIEGELANLAETDVRFMFPAVILACVLLLGASLRCVRGVTLPLIVVVASVLWSFGLMGWSGARMFPIYSMIPTMLVAIGVANGIHVIQHFLLHCAQEPGTSAHDAVVATMDKIAPPIAMASITTAVGMASLMTSAMVPVRGFGIFAAIGVLAAMLFSFTFVPAALCLMGPPRTIRRSAKPGATSTTLASRVLGNAKHLVLDRPVSAAALGIALTVFGLAGLPYVVVDGSMVANFPKDNAVARSDQLFIEKFGGSQPFEVVLEAENADAWKDPRLLRALQGLQDHIAEEGYASKTRSVVDYVRRMNQVMRPGDPNADSVPPTSDLIAQYLLLYSISGEPDDFDDVIDYDYRTANLRVQTDSDHSPALARAVHDIEQYAAENLEPLGVKTQVSGSGRTILAFVHLIVGGQVKSLLVALFFVAILASLMCWSVTGGLLTVMPVAIATVLNFGMLGWTGTPLGVTTALISSIGIGIGVDYAIHFVTAYRSALGSGADPDEALAQTLGSTGVAIFYNALVVLGGFLVLGTSEFLPNRALGLLVAFNMAICFLVTVTALPAALRLLKPSFLTS